MGKLAVERPETTEAFEKMLGGQAPLPWRLVTENTEWVYVEDFHGAMVFNLSMFSKADAIKVGSAIIVAVNTCGGFKLEPNEP
jgi:hypothetical protein